jgi:hypothetical protein
VTRLLLAVLSGLVLLQISCIQKREARPVSDESLIRGRLTQFESALAGKEVQLLNNYYSRGEVLVFPLWEEVGLKNWEEVLVYWKNNED